MVIVISTSIAAVFLTYLSSMSRYKRFKLFELAIFLITFLQMIHYDYGTDYMSYLNDHLMYRGSIARLRYFRLNGSGAFKDLGWVVIGYLFQGEIGFYILVGVLSIIQNYIYYRFIRDYTEPRYRWKAVMIFLFVPSFYVLNFSALRQGFAVSLCVFAFMLITKDRLKSAILVVLLAGTIHSSALIFLPFLFISIVPLKRMRKYAVILIAAIVVLYFGTAIVNDFAVFVINHIPIFERNYGNYLETMKAAGKLPGFGFVLNSVKYLVLIYFIFNRFDELNYEQRMLVLLTCVSYCVIPFQMNVTGLMSRVATYFSVFQMIAIPVTYSKIRNKITRIGVSFIYIFMMLYEYYGFFFITKWSSESFRTFHTIFGQILK